MNYENRRPDRTDHRREIESRRHDRRGPSRRDIKNATEDVADHEIPGTPNLSTLSIIKAGINIPFEVEGRRVTGLRIQEGRPEHGELRSDPHISRYEVEFPLSEVDPAVLEGDACPHCGGERGKYRYNAHHHIAGGESVWCLRCEEQLYDKSWG